jgi:hypothetical protein
MLVGFPDTLQPARLRAARVTPSATGRRAAGFER